MPILDLWNVYAPRWCIMGDPGWRRGIPFFWKAEKWWREREFGERKNSIKVYSLVVAYIILWAYTIFWFEPISIPLLVLFKMSASLLIFCLLSLSLILRCELKYSTVIEDLPISPYSSIHFCFVNIEYFNQVYISLELLSITSEFNLILALTPLYCNY